MIEIFEQVPGGDPESRPSAERVPGGDPESRRPVWRGESGGPIFVPDDVQARRQQSYHLVNQQAFAGLGDDVPADIIANRMKNNDFYLVAEKKARAMAGISNQRRQALADSAMPGDIPPDVQSKRSRGFLVTTSSGDSLVLARQPDFSDRQRSYIPLGGLGEDVMLLEYLGDNEATAPTAVADYSERKAKLRDLIQKRREAICKAGIERDKATEKVFRYDRLIRQLQQEAKSSDPSIVADRQARIAKANALRAILAGNAIRFAKVQALGQAMLKSAVTELNFLTLSEMASKRGVPDAAQTLLAAADKAASNDAHYGDLRQKQIANWAAQAADGKLKALNIMLAQVVQQIAALSAQQVSDAMAGEKARQLQNLKVKQEKIQNKIEEVKQQVISTGITAAQVQVAISAPPIEQKAQLAGAFYGLEADFGNLSGFWDAVGGAISDAAGAVKDGVVAAANAGVDLIKQGACALANNPAITSAVSSAVAGAVTGGPGAIAGGAASSAATKVLSSACPSAPATPAPLPIMGYMTQAPLNQINSGQVKLIKTAPSTSKVLPIALGVGAAGIIAAFFALA